MRTVSAIHRFAKHSGHHRKPSDSRHPASRRCLEARSVKTAAATWSGGQLHLRDHVNPVTPVVSPGSAVRFKTTTNVTIASALSAAQRHSLMATSLDDATTNAWRAAVSRNCCFSSDKSTAPIANANPKPARWTWATSTIVARSGSCDGKPGNAN